MKRSVFGLVLALCGVAAANDGVWSDAVLRIRGAVDRNGDGIFTPTDYTDPAAVEIPDPMRPATAAAKISYNMTRHADSDVRIVEREVKLASEGRTVTRPVLYFPQPHFVEGGVNKARLQALKLLNGGSPITNDQWSAVFRLKPDGIYTLQKKAQNGTPATTGTSWFFHFPVSGTRGEMRLGLRTKNGNASGFVNLCAGNATNNEKMELLLTNACDWAEISITVDRRQVRLSCGQPGRMRRWANHVIPSADANSNAPVGTIQPTSFRLGDCNRGAVESCDYGNADAFRGWVETVGIWNRVLTDAEVVEAFGGANPALVQIGEEGASARMFDGAKATGPVTLDATVADQRAWPAAYGPGAVLTIPFTVDTYRANMPQALRIVPQAASASGAFLAKVDGVDVGRIPVRRTAPGGVPEPTFLALDAARFTPGAHVLTLTCVSATGDIRLDAVQLGGSWRVGDESGADVSYDSDTSWASSNEAFGWAGTYYAASMNIKDFVWYLGGNTARRRDKIVCWNVPRGFAEHARYRLFYKLVNAGGVNGKTVRDRNILTLVNGETVDTCKAVGSFTRSVELPEGALRDGLNEIRLAVETLDSDYVWINPTTIKLEMTSCETDWKPGVTIIVR